MQTHGSPTRSGEEGTSVVDRGLESSLILSKMVKYLDGGCKDGIFSYRGSSSLQAKEQRV